MTATYETLMALDRQLERAGHRPLTPWWQAQLQRFYGGEATTFVGRVGRGGVKSHTSAKVALNETIHGDWRIPPGERHYFAFISATKDEASQRLLLLESFLRSLGVAFDTQGDVIALRGEPRGFRVFAAQVRAVSGFRCYGYAEDELAKWNVDGVNPSEEITTSVDAMTITHPGARKLLISSPLGRLDYHFQRFAEGDTREQIVAHAETWTSNPSVTQEQCRRLAGSERIFLREYAAIPSTTADACFDPAAIEAAFALTTGNALRGQRVIVLDPSSGRKDAWTWGVVGWDWPAPRQPGILRFDVIDGVSAGFFKGVRAEAVVERVARLAKVHDVRVVHADQRESLMLESAFSRHGLAYRVHDWTASSKPEGVERVRRWMADGRLSLPEHDTLRRELLAFEEKITPSGSLTFGARGSGHDDYVSLLITAALAIAGDGEARTDWSHAKRINDRIMGRDRGLNEPPLPHRDFINLGRWRGFGRGFG